MRKSVVLFQKTTKIPKVQKRVILQGTLRIPWLSWSGCCRFAELREHCLLLLENRWVLPSPLWLDMKQKSFHHHNFCQRLTLRRLPESFQAAVAESHRLAGLSTTEMYFSESGNWEVQDSDTGRFSVWWDSASGSQISLFTVSPNREGGRDELLRVSFIKAQIPFSLLKRMWGSAVNFRLPFMAYSFWWPVWARSLCPSRVPSLE